MPVATPDAAVESPAMKIVRWANAGSGNAASMRTRAHKAMTDLGNAPESDLAVMVMAEVSRTDCTNERRRERKARVVRDGKGRRRRGRRTRVVTDGKRGDVTDYWPA